MSPSRLAFGAVRSLTGKEEYQFGDITRSFIKAWKAGNEKTGEPDGGGAGDDGDGDEKQRR